MTDELRPDPEKPIGDDYFAPPDVDTDVPDEPIPDDVTEEADEAEDDPKAPKVDIPVEDGS